MKNVTHPSHANSEKGWDCVILYVFMIPIIQKRINASPAGKPISDKNNKNVLCTGYMKRAMIFGTFMVSTTVVK